MSTKLRSYLPVTPPADRLYTKLTGGHIPGLDGIRAVAVSAVVLGHLGLPAPFAQGVSTFFVLSGFLITWLLLQEKQRTGTISIKQFYFRRSLRILPAFYGFWILYVVLDIVFQHHPDWPQYFAAGFYALNYYVIFVTPPHAKMAHTWSLAVEEQFYLLWPCVFLLLSSNLRFFAKCLAGFIASVWIYRIILFHTGSPAFRIEIGFDTRADQLAVGCLMAILLTSSQVRTFIERVSGYTLSIIAVLLACVSVELARRVGAPYTSQIGFAVDGILAAVIMVQAIAGSHLWIWRILEIRAVRYLGTISYGVYLYHWIGNKAVMRYIEQYGKVAEVLAAFALGGRCGVPLVLSRGAPLPALERSFIAPGESYTCSADACRLAASVAQRADRPAHVTE